MSDLAMSPLRSALRTSEQTHLLDIVAVREDGVSDGDSLIAIAREGKS